MFITFEGPEGAGKSTQLRLLADTFRSDGFDVVVSYEPGGTSLGDAIRKLLLAPESASPLTPRAEALLFAAARAQLVDEVVRPGLASGAIVLCDRFSDSTFAYQVSGRGLPADEVAQVVRFATGGLKPDLTFLLDLDVTAGLLRKRAALVDRMEREEISFHERVRSGYLMLARREPDRIVLLDAQRPVGELAAEIRQRAFARLRAAS